MENEENYVPYTRKKYNLPDEKTATKVDYAEIFDETPIYAIWRMFIMQALSVRLFSKCVLFANYWFSVVGGATCCAYFFWVVFPLEI